MAKKSLDLDVDSPEKVITVLYNAVDAFMEASSELQSAWQDPKAGAEWKMIAKELEKAKLNIYKKLRRY